MKYPCLVLDHDDTFVQTQKTTGYPYFKEYIERVRPGIKLSYGEYARVCNDAVFSDMCRQQWNLTEEELNEEYLGWNAYSRCHIPEIYPGMDRLIRRQRAEGGIICVASMSITEIIERDYLHHVGFLPDMIYGYDLPPEKRKPSSFALEDIMRRFGLKPEQLLVVDDMMQGWTMASRVGVPTAFAGWSKADFPEYKGNMQKHCTYTFDTPADFEGFLFE